MDLNNAQVAFILTEYARFTTAASYAGSHYRVDHDISMLVPDLWCRIRVEAVAAAGSESGIVPFRRRSRADRQFHE